MFNMKGKYTSAIIYAEEIDQICISQITEFINHPAFTNKVYMMPDAHAGEGAAIGFTMKRTDKIIPNVIGVDINCGMLSIKIRLDNLDYKYIDDYIRENIPFGQNVHNRPLTNTNALPYLYDFIDIKCKQIGMNPDYFMCSLGTLGSGNHFIEFGRDSENYLWITVHSGSRNFGKKICEYWQEKAAEILEEPKHQFFTEELKRIKEKYKGKDIEIKIKELKDKLFIGQVNKKLAFLTSENADNYLLDMKIAEFYANKNRKLIMQQILKGLPLVQPLEIIETVHNYLNFNDNIIRKGAISSYKGEKMIIPLNMRDGILLCEGKSNRDWNYSAPHGSGRIFSRADAKEKINLEKFKKDMEGIYSTSICSSTLDESPDAYKNSEIIKKLIEPTATIIDVIKPIINLKDNEENKKSWKEIKEERRKSKNYGK